MDPVTILGVIGSLASIISLGQDVIRSRNTGQAAEQLEPAQAMAQIERTAEEFRRDRRLIGILSKISDDPAVEAIIGRIDLRQRKARLKIESGEDITEEVEALTKEICEFLKAVRRLLGGHLPSDRFVELWKNYGCEA